MTKLWILLAGSLILAGWIDYRDRVLARRGHSRKERLFTCILILVLAFFCGLRTKGNDTGTYRDVYRYLTPTLQEALRQDMPSLAASIGLHYTSALMKSLNFSVQDFLMFFAFATIIPYVNFVHRYSKTMLFGIFLMFTTGMYTFSLAALKQCMATGICLMALPAAEEENWKRYILLVFLGALFHAYALIYLIVPLMMFKPMTLRTFLYMVIFIGAGFLLEPLLGVVLNITDLMGADYTTDSFTGEGVSLFRVLVAFAPLLIAMLCGKQIFSESTKLDDLMFNLSMLNALIMFVGLFGTANYFARLANYFLPAQVITIPWLLSKLPAKDRRWVKPLCVLCYLAYFAYEGNLRDGFDATYLHMSLWDYLATLF